MNSQARCSLAANLLEFDFNGANPWPHASATASRGATAKVSFGPQGTVDEAGSKQASGGLLLATGSAPNGVWTAGGISGPLAIRNAEKDPGKLTLSFSLSASMARPVIVRLESRDAHQQRTGELEATIYPAAPDFYQRYALDLSTMRPAGVGKFEPGDGFVQLSFEISAAAGWPAALKHELRLDNLHYASPAFYVSAQGDDKNDGRTERTAFANPQKAIDAAGPGDIILVMNGTYKPVGVQGGIAAFRRGGTPSAWISLKNYPGHTPLFFVTSAWAAVRLGRPAPPKPTAGAVLPTAGTILPTLCYIEVRGMHVRGEADVAKEKYAEFMDKADPHTNSNGIMVDGGNESNPPHHLRFADNLVEYCCGGGITAGNADWVTMENNTIRNNCWWMIYAGSGISLLGTANFDQVDNVYKDLIRNNHVSGNRCFLQWKQIGKFSDGNGIIIDSNHVPAQNKSHRGRTLIQNNVSFNNGGSGIHSFKSHRVDIINNTAYYNGATPELRWGQIFLQRTDDARVINNILVSRADQPVNTVSANSSDKENTNVVRAHNVYFGGNAPPLMGEADIVADPQFVHASTDEKVADFHLKPGSPAWKTGRIEAFSPFLDLDGKPRGAKPDVGAYQQ